jgi:large subunit ribosomal protein L20
MARVKRGTTTHARHKKVLDLAKGYRGRGSKAYRIALEKVEKALRYAYRDRRNKKRDFRGLWIQRINAGVREHGMTYSQFIHGLSGRFFYRHPGAGRDPFSRWASAFAGAALRADLLAGAFARPRAD